MFEVIGDYISRHSNLVALFKGFICIVIVLLMIPVGCFVDTKIPSNGKPILPDYCARGTLIELIGLILLGAVSVSFTIIIPTMFVILIILAICNSYEIDIHQCHEIKVLMGTTFGKDGYETINDTSGNNDV